MRVRVLLFAAYRELAGARETDVELPPGATVGALVATLRQRWPALPADAAVAVDREFAPRDRALHDGCEAALIPPVSGG